MQQYQFDILNVSLTFLNMHLLITRKRMNKQSIDAPIGPLTSNKQNLKWMEKIQQRVSSSLTWSRWILDYAYLNICKSKTLRAHSKGNLS